jgi:cob(I)alamin adenosyltransferase
LTLGTRADQEEIDMRLYTARGDQGETDLLGERVVKDDPGST